MTEVLTADVLRQYPPGRGGSMCKRIRRTAALYRVAWRFKKKRWPKGWNPKARVHGWHNSSRAYAIGATRFAARIAERS